MKLISYRGNIDGVNPELENTISQIENAINNGFDVMIDIFLKDKKLHLGSVENSTQLEIDWLEKYHTKLWLNCKDPELLSKFLDLDAIGKHLHYFWFDDKPTLTSRNYVISTREHIASRFVIMHPEDGDDITNVYGICSSNPKKYI